MPALDEIKDFLKKEIVDTMYMSPDELDADALFSSYGLESVTLVKIVSKVNENFSTNLEAKDILPHQSLSRAASAIHALLEGERT